MTSLNNLMAVFFSMAIFTLVILLIIYGKSILLPLVIAFFIWYVINALASLLGKIRIADHNLSKSLCLIMTTLLLLLIFVLLADAVKTNVVELSHSSADISAQLNTKTRLLADKLHISSASI